MYYSSLYALSQLYGVCCSILWVVLLVALVLLLIRAFTTNRFAEETVIERWSAFLPGQGALAARYLEDVEHILCTRSVPFKRRAQRIPVSITSNERHDFLACEMSSDYTCFIGCVPVGSDLEVNWLIQDHTIRGIYKVPLIGPLLLSLNKRYTFANGNKVRAFASVTHACAVEAAERILDEARADRAKLNRKTSGKLGPL